MDFISNIYFILKKYYKIDRTPTYLNFCCKVILCFYKYHYVKQKFKKIFINIE